MPGGKEGRDAFDRTHRDTGPAVRRRSYGHGCHVAPAERRPRDGDFDQDHQERLTTGATSRPEAAVVGWQLPAEEVTEMLTIGLIAVLSSALALLTGAMIVAQVSRGRLADLDTQRGTSR